MTQAQALDILKMGESVFLTGEPGSGKTYVVNQYVRWLKKCGVNPSVTASTGVAATHIGGLTLHSWSGAGIRTELTRADIARIKHSRRVAARVRGAHVLIIDEISMLSGKVLDVVNMVCQHLRENPAPFGGLQVVMVGDFFQLPPVKRAEGFAFESEVWKDLEPKVCYLSEQHRQNDPVFLEILSAIRSGRVMLHHREALSSRAEQKPPEEIVRFFSRNVDVDRINTGELERIEAEEQEFVMTGSGDEKYVERLMESCLSPRSLILKEGARVMFTKNDLGLRYVNGTFGVVSGFSEDGLPIVKIDSGGRIVAERAEWLMEDGEKILAKVSQVPLRLAWAITAHKSQGMSLDRAHMDLSDAFEYGQGYVAISRVRSLSGVYLSGFNERALQVHPQINSKDLEFRDASEDVEKFLADIPAEELVSRQEQFVESCGGRIRGEGDDETFLDLEEEKPRHTKKMRGGGWRKTLLALREARSIEDAASVRGITTETIFRHLGKAKEEKCLKPEDVLHLRGVNKKEMGKVHKVFDVVGADLLKPVFEKLGGEVSYETIKLARLLYKLDD